MPNDNFPDGTTAWFRGDEEVYTETDVDRMQARAVERERARIVAAIRRRASEWPMLDTATVMTKRTLEFTADWIERGCPDGE